MGRTPGAVRLKIFLLTTVSVMDTAVQHQLFGATLKFGGRHLYHKLNWILIELSPARGIKVEEQVRGIRVPAPPQIAGERPQSLLDRRDKAVESTRFAD